MATTCVVLPVETIEIDILPRLPVKSLLRFKSVCKSWNLLISSNNFIKFVNHDSLALMLKRKLKYAINISGEYKEFTWIVGCINGVVCVWDSLGYFGAMGFVIWNPATKQCLKIAPPSYENFNVLGFGFDSVANDFKIMHVTTIEEQSLVGYIYSCNARCWSKIAPSNFLYRGCILKPRQPIIVNGNPFWLNEKIPFRFNGKKSYLNEHLVVISFDARREFYKLLPDFSSIHESEKGRYNLLNFKNSVAVMYYNYRSSQAETIDIYIFNERCSDWSKMSIGPFISIAKMPDSHEFLQCFSNGDILFVSSHRKELYCVNIRNHTIKSLGKLRDHIIYGCTYSESLVFIDGMNPFYKKEDEDDVRLFFLKNDCKSIYKREIRKNGFSKKKK